MSVTWSADGRLRGLGLALAVIATPGLASSLLNTSQQVGGAIGLARS